MTVNSVFEYFLSTTPINTSAQNTFGGLQNSQVTPSFANTLRSAFTGSGGDELNAIFDAAGRKYNISPDLLKAVAKVESGFKPEVVSRAGAMGIMQLMPGTAAGLGVNNAFDPEQNIMGGAKYLKQQLDRFGGDVRLALAAYNAGPGAVNKYGGIPPFKETQAYVPKVLGLLDDSYVAAGNFTYNGAGTPGDNSMINGFTADGSQQETSNGTQPVFSGQYQQGADQLPQQAQFNFSAALMQMLFIRIIEMQMSSSGDDKRNSIIF